LTARGRSSLVPDFSWVRTASVVGALVVTMALAIVVPKVVHRDEVFDAVVQITGKTVVDADENGTPLLIDVQMEWDACPGDQVQVVRGGTEFARCLASVKVGDYTAVKVTHLWDSRGFYSWDLSNVGGCNHPIERNTPGSYERSQECEATSSHGHRDGFVCDRRPYRELLAVCPWMGR
jgi:hypothetical protein